MTRRSGLGRGLDALLPTHPPEGEPHAPAGPHHVGVDLIDPNPQQPRRAFDDTSLAELAASIGQLGVLQPLLVRPRGEGRFELVAGERRLRAARSAGLDHVPVVVAETDEVGSLERALVENLHREDLNAIEEAAALRQLMDEGGMTQEALGRRLGRSRVTIANALRLLDLPVAVQRQIIEGRLSAAHGKALLGLHGSPFQERLARRAGQEGLSVRDTEDLVRRYQAMSGRPAPRGAGAAERPAAVSDAQRRLSDLLQTRVRVEMGRRKGRIVLDFVSLEELERIVGILTGEAPGASPRTIRLD
ncbi:MAG: ParB/RepB/Spo0J family partition protein [Actinomycetota bacterium]